MNRKRYALTVLFLIGASCGFGAVPVTVEVVEVSKIWDKAPHSAFTDLVRWNDGFYCAFRQGRGHVSSDGKIRVLKSKDGDSWESAVLVKLDGYDLRDAHLSVTPDARLMLLGGAAPRKQDNQGAPTGTFVSFSQDGEQWTKPQIVVQPGRWLWCVTWHKTKAYGVSYTAGKGGRYLDLLVSDDGINYDKHVAELFEQGYPTEVTLRFDIDGTCYALVRRDRHGSESSSALLGVSKPDYKKWRWHDLGAEYNGFGGPNFIRIPGGHWIGAGRMHQGGAHTALTYIDVTDGTMTKLAKLPSGGDTSYPGLVWHNNMLYVSYYSSHEGKTSIYLAKVKIRPTGLRKITGVVRDEKGKLVAGAEVRRLHGPGPVNTDTKGKYELVWDPVRNRPLLDTYYIIARHHQDNLSVVVGVPEFDQENKTVNLNLQPGVIFKGRVVDPAGGEIEMAHVSILLHTPTQGSGLYDTITDSEGIFEFRGIPTGHEYSFATRASGHGTKWVHDIYVGHDFAQKDYNLEPITLAIADQSVSGLVVDANDKPISGAILWTDGEGQPNYNIRTDAEGKFTIDEVCAGNLRIFATVRGEILLSGYARTQGGATDVRIVVTEKPSPDRRRFVPNSPPSLVGRVLPKLKDLGIELSSTDPQNEKMLLCFFDIEQRPSRNCIKQLVKQAEQIKEKGVTIIAVQASKVDEDKLNEWVKENKIPFPVGMIEGNEEKTRFTWGVRSLPWLILTDKEHIVQAEGFGINALDVQVESKELVAETGSIEVRVTAESNGRPLEDARISFMNTETDEDFVVFTNEKGIARIDLMLGDYTMTNVSKEDYVSHKQDVLMIVESDKVNRIDIDLAEAPKITGYVRDQNGKGVEGTYVHMVPFGPRNLISDTNGKFEFRWDPRPAQLFLVARHIERDLAGSIQYRTEDMGVKIKVRPSLVLTGRVADSNGTGIPEAWVEAKILTGRGPVGIAETKVNSKGQYRINALPTGHRYSVQAGREGYGEVFKELVQKPIHRTPVQIETIVLNVANLSISGVVEDANGNTVKEAKVQCWGNGQPKLQTTMTDAEGTFVIQNVCKGPLRIQAAKDRLNKAIDAEGGKDNIRIILRPRQPTAAKTWSLLAGKILPQLGAIDINFNAKQAKGTNILVCFFDMNQRPSRNCITQLAKQVEKLKEKGVTIVAVQASKVDKDKLNEWVKENKIPFPVGMIEGDEEKTNFAWGIKSLPWLILTDKEHIVTAEGFSISELNEKIKH